MPIVGHVRRFLHKPTQAHMRAAGAVLVASPSPAHAATAIPTGEMVYTDSVFCIDRPTCRRLEQVKAPETERGQGARPVCGLTAALGLFLCRTRQFYHAHRPLQCEIDAYGDFLQALGPEATPDYTANAGNVVAAAPGTFGFSAWLTTQMADRVAPFAFRDRVQRWSGRGGPCSTPCAACRCTRSC